MRHRRTTGSTRTVIVWYHGKPISAKNPPWDGGLIWRHDSLGNPWVATANEGLGASVWWPNKDYLADEPDSQRIAITVPDPMVDVSNGRLRSTTKNADGTSTFEWFVANPINNYNAEINAGTYAHFSEVYQGEKGALTLDFWPLAYHVDTARVQFQQARSMIACFEHWFGPYPWYEDGYKLVEAPHLGMEHQSGVAYGNRYRNGYLGRDLSGTGTGLKWDFIIVHESGHEWFGNNITARDQADMWIHEGFTNYSEGLYTECQQGKAAGAEYIIGSRRNIRNDRPIIAPYGVNAEGSDDMYYKTGSMLHTMRQVVNDDEKWRGVLRGLNKTFWHQTVTARQVEDYVDKAVGHQLRQGVRAVPHDDEGAGARVPHRGADPLVSLGRRRGRIRHAREGHAGQRRLLAHPADRVVAAGPDSPRRRGGLHGRREFLRHGAEGGRRSASQLVSGTCCAPTVRGSRPSARIVATTSCTYGLVPPRCT